MRVRLQSKQSTTRPFVVHKARVRSRRNYRIESTRPKVRQICLLTNLDESFSGIITSVPTITLNFLPGTKLMFSSTPHFPASP